MSTTNHTTNYELSQYMGTDVTSYLSNYNSDMYKIDAQMKVNATAAASAQSDASAAVSAATTAASSASAAVSTANAANTAAEAAQTAATAAQTAAGTAQTDAAAALRASASNAIGNLAPAYDHNLTYVVGNLVTYVDPETNQGKLYKNIVPIEDPEEFNINKWDDVTTSEVYARKSELISTIASDGIKTFKELFNELCPSSFDVNSEYILTVTEDGVTDFIHARTCANNFTVFVINYPSTSVFGSVTYNISNDSALGVVTIDNNGFSYENRSNIVAPIGKTYKLYKLTTI